MPRKSKSIPEVRRMVADDSLALIAAADALVAATLALSGAVPRVVRQVGGLARTPAGRRDDFLRRGESLAAAHLLITYTASGPPFRTSSARSTFL